MGGVVVVVVCKILWRWWLICVCAYIYIYIYIHVNFTFHPSLTVLRKLFKMAYWWKCSCLFNEGQPGKLLIFLFHAWVQVRSIVTCNSCLIRGKHKLSFLLGYRADRSNKPLTLDKNQKPESSSEADSYSADKEVSILLWNPKFRYGWNLFPASFIQSMPSQTACL
jgi:hypothetical protein